MLQTSSFRRDKIEIVRNAQTVEVLVINSYADVPELSLGSNWLSG